MDRTEAFICEIKGAISDNILPFWIERMKDPKGGFYGRMSGEGELDKDADRGVILNARIIWAFSAAYKATGNKEYLLAATHAKEYFQEHFMDHKHGGVYWSVDRDGKRKDTKKQLYAQAFAIYGLSEYYSASGDDQALKASRNLFQITEKRFADKENGGYVEALTRDFSPLEDMSLSAHDINADKTMNSHLHLLEAYTNLYKVWPERKLKERTSALLEILTDKIIDKQTGHLNLYFTKEWNVIPGGVSFGHDIETSWLALESAFILKDIDLINKVKPCCLKIGQAGLEGLLEDGSMIYEKKADGTLDESRQWWVQAETVVGLLWLWKYHNLSEGADKAVSGWNYIKNNLVDTKNGEWYWSIEADGSVNTKDDKAGFWKCPYHNSRMCLEVLKIFG